MHQRGVLPKSLIASALALFALGTQAAISEDFSAGDGGWRVVDLPGLGDYSSIQGTLPVTYHATGGVSNGYISALDPSSNAFYFDAPGRYTGNLSGYLGGTLAFDTFYIPNDANARWRADPDVVLSNGTTYLVWQAAANPDATWTHVGMTLGASNGWKVGSLDGADATAADFASVLGNVTSLRLRGEYYTGVVENTGIDNVVLAAVPEPESWAMLVAGLGLIGLGRRRQPIA